MRVVLTGLPVYSHLVPMVVPVARVLAAAGHDVAVATGSAMTEELERHGVTHLPLPRMLGPGQLGSDPEFARSIGLSPEGVPLPQLEPLPPGEAFGRLFAGLGAVRTAEDLLAAAADWRPDLMVRECTEFGGYLVAECLGVPCVTLDIAPLTPSRHPGILSRLNQSRGTLGLPPIADLATLTRWPWISWLPEAWYPPDLHTRAYRHYRAVEDVESILDPQIAELPADRPFVLATFGSNTGHMLTAGDETLLGRLVTALGTIDCTALVALGSKTDPAGWDGPRPDNVHLTSFAPQRLLLPTCDLFVTHAGFGGVREALTAGVPMVALPLYAEQPANARRIVELGVGIALESDDRDSATLAQACRQVLNTPSYRQRARGMQRRLLSLPGRDGLVAELATLVA